MRYSLSTFVYYRYTLIEALRRIKKFGYDGVEIWGGRPHAYYEDMTEDRIELVYNTLKELDLAVSNYIPAQFRYPTNLSSTDEGIRSNSVKYILRNIDVAEKLSSPYVSICPGFSTYGDKPLEAYGALCKSIDDILNYSNNKKLQIIIEPAHPMETDIIVTVNHAIELINKFGKQNLGLCVDTGHLFVNKESLSDVYDITKGLIVHYHIDDNMGISDDHLIPGDGKINFTTFINNLKANDYKGFLAVELGMSYTNDPDSAVIKSLEYLKKVK